MRQFCIGLLLIWPLSAWGQDSERCALIGDDEKRLACYDTQADRMSAATSIPSAWQVSRDVDPLSDQVTVFFSTESSSGVNAVGWPVILALRCNGIERSGTGQFEAYILWDDYLGSEDQISATVRFGQEPPVDMRMNTSTSDTASFFNLLSARNQLIWQLYQPDGRLVVRTTPYRENPITAVFDIGGSATVADELLETCNQINLRDRITSCLSRGETYYRQRDEWPLLESGEDAEQAVASGCAQRPASRRLWSDN